MIMSWSSSSPIKNITLVWPHNLTMQITGTREEKLFLRQTRSIWTTWGDLGDQIDCEPPSLLNIGWWFQPIFIFPSIKKWSVHELIFWIVVETTNQWIFLAKWWTIIMMLAKWAMMGGQSSRSHPAFAKLGLGVCKISLKIIRDWDQYIYIRIYIYYSMDLW